MPEGWESALAVVAHPDDLEYGTASAIARWTSQGKTIRYVMVASGEAGIDGMHPDEAGPLREREEQASAKVVGVDEVEFLRYTDGVIEVRLAAPQGHRTRNPALQAGRGDHARLRPHARRRVARDGGPPGRRPRDAGRCQGRREPGGYSRSCSTRAWSRGTESSSPA